MPKFLSTIVHLMLKSHALSRYSQLGREVENSDTETLIKRFIKSPSHNNYFASLKV